MNNPSRPDLQPLRDAIQPRDALTAKACRLRLTDPPGLGRLRQLAAWVAGAQGQDPPHPLDDVRVVALAGEHGVAAADQAFTPGHTVAAVRELASGAGPINALARLQDVRVRVLDLAVDADPTELPAGARAFTVRRGSGPIDQRDALTPQELSAAFTAGTQIADQEIDSGADLLVPVCLGAGSDIVAAAVVAVLLGLSALDVVGVPPGTDDESWARKVAAVRDASYRGRRVRTDALEVLQCVGSADVVALTGLLVQAAVRRTPVLLDGPLVCAGALAARRLVEGSQDWWLAAHRSSNPAHQRALDVLGLEPLIDLNISLGGVLDGGVGALTALGVLRSAVAVAELA